MNFRDIYALVLKEYPDILTVDEMSKALGVSTKTGYQLLRENKIEHLKVGRAYKVPKAHLLSYLRLGAYELWRYICVSLKRIPRHFNRR